MSSARDALGRHVQHGLPPRDVVEKALDKRALLAAAATAGLDAPATIVCSTPTEATTAARLLGYPVLLKPTASIAWEGKGMCERATGRAEDDAALERLLKPLAAPFLVQQAERGQLYSVAGVMAGRRLLATVASCYRRTWPVAAGAAAFSETLAFPLGLRERVEALLCTLGWEGIFEVELIRRDDGSFAAIDVNPRLYGSLALAEAAGAPIATVWCDWLLGGNPSPVSARSGVRYRCEDADFRHALWQLRHGRLAQALEVFVPSRRVTHAYARLRDPGPPVARLLFLVRNAAGRAARQWRGTSAR